MATIQQLESHRDDLLQQMRSIRSMKRGTITEQLLKVRHKGVKEKVHCGPYYVFSRYEAEARKTKSRRLSPGEELAVNRRLRKAVKI